MENNSAFKQNLLLFNRNTELLRLIRSNFDSKVDYLKKMRKRNIHVMKNLMKRKLLLIALLEESESTRVLWKLVSKTWLL